ncbi:hypothetical protein SAMN05216576_107178 [Ectopseudomonas chengduensis]|jgi:hypothetical protein|uniref:Uncharacterized protein n=1 Tax=Ectopseudomonas chengduensis TaxID=489632 RepID=A0A1G6PZU2_9GAMM|nr:MULTISPECIES: hypothetical protein [Pseudomonas]MBP3062009.1 hypothetical protein [Pseudomonas chengduensis]NNB75303.1 hypothetical protein [Pseudomonas chengduensis]SDC85588.1 hypothetical protein SAMN05216576_107178 [Pseudomonas chengduensis]
MHSLQLALIAALVAELNEHKEAGYTDATYKPFVTLLRRAGAELVESQGIPGSLIFAQVEAIFCAESYERVLNGGVADGDFEGYHASAVGSPNGSVVLTLRLS